MKSGGALFGSSATGVGSTGGNKHLVEMRAGKMNLKGRMVYPDKRKGLLYIYQSDDSLIHFCWQDRTTGLVEDDLIIFPDDCEFVKVPQCTTGRVYLLKFKCRKFFFWVQEPKTDKDEENCNKINELLNNPSSLMVQSTQSQDQDLQSLLNNMSQSQLIQLFGSGVGQMGGLSSLLGTIRGPNSGSARTNTTPALTHRSSTTSTPATTTTSTPPVSTPAQTSTTTATTTATTPSTPAQQLQWTGTFVPNAPARTRQAARSTEGTRTTTTTGATPANPIQLSDLQNFLQGIAPMASTPGQPQSVDLSTALTSDALSGVLSNPDALTQLQSHLPPVDGTTQEALRSTLASPQFQQAVSQFSSALESGQLGPVVSQLAVNPEAVNAAAQGNMQDFVKALEKSGGAEGTASGATKDKAKGTPKKDDKKKDDDDEQMQLD